MMNQQEILRKIGRIIQELQDQQLYLSQTSNINLLELELFTANADFLIDHIEILKKLNQQNIKVENIVETVLEIEPIPTEMESITEVVVDYPPEIDLDEDYNEDESINGQVEAIEKPFFAFSLENEPIEMVFDFEKEAPIEEVFDRNLSDEEKDLLDKNAQLLKETSKIIIDDEEDGPEPFLIINEVEEIISLEKADDVVIIEPKIVELPVEVKVEKQVKPETKVTLNEMLSVQKEQKQTTIKSGKSNIDLKTTISLNDKMIFIKDLFNGYNLAYSEAIEIISRFESFEAADNFLTKNYAQKNNWVDKNDVVDRFYEYLNRKFGA